MNRFLTAGLRQLGWALGCALLLCCTVQPGNVALAASAGEAALTEAPPAASKAAEAAAVDVVQETEAAGAEAAPQAVDKAGLATAGGLARWFISTLAVLCVILLIAYFLKKTRFVRTRNAQLEIASMLSLGPKEKVVLLRTHGRELLLGVTAQQVNLLCDLSAAASSRNVDREAEIFNAALQEAAGSSAAATVAAGTEAGTVPEADLADPRQGQQPSVQDKGDAVGLMTHVGLRRRYKQDRGADK